ncbi:MAG: hypothetical protein O9284_17620 [Steroidobacteraceae bacterium]|nr:hypothetical protein [Steroidobacteraceae bacterium]
MSRPIGRFARSPRASAPGFVAAPVAVTVVSNAGDLELTIPPGPRIVGSNSSGLSFAASGAIRVGFRGDLLPAGVGVDYTPALVVRATGPYDPSGAITGSPQP